MYPRYALLVVSLLALGVGVCRGADADRDGLPDEFEDAILAKFVPVFYISSSDCDVAPAEFDRAAPNPIVKTRNGTIYGQVFALDRAQPSIEVHFYHLWGKDCGQSSHPLDVEGVSVLLQADREEWRPEAWRAVFWYAAAHENTLCDMGNGAGAAALGAVEHGPQVWVSRNKHASFLNKNLCTQGCGKDECEGTEAMRIAKLVNLGEPGAPIQGVDWSVSNSWPLAEKMSPDFTEALIARMPAGNQAELVPARGVARGMRTTIKVADNTYSSLATANSNAGMALATGFDAVAASSIFSAQQVGQSVERSLETALSSTGRSLKRTFHWIGKRIDSQP